MQNVNHDNFAQGQSSGQTEQQNVAYQGNADPALAAAGGSAQQNGVTNITNIIYNFNLTPSQQLHKQQIEQQMLLQQQ